MSEIITKDDGSQVEVFTAEEIQSQKDIAIEEYKTANPDKSEERSKLQEKLKGFEDKDLNFSHLRKQKEEAEKKVEDILKGVDDKINTVKKEVLEGVMKDHYNDTIKKLVGDDKELLSKVELQYKRLGDPAGTKDEVSRKMNDAFLLATGTSQINDNSAFSSAGVGRIKVENNIQKLSEEEKQMARELAKAGGMVLTDEDFKNK